MVKAGLGDDVVVSMVKGQPGRYSTGPDDLIALKSAGVSDKVIAAMVNSGAAAGPAPAATAPGAGAAKKVQEPEYVGVVFCLDPAGALTPLERQQSNAAFKTKALGFGGGQNSIIYKGARSPVRFKVGQELQFVVRLQVPAGIEPDSLVNLDVLKVSKNERAIITAKVGAMGLGGAKSQKGETSRPLNFSKYGEESLKISPAQPLEAGEYVITTRLVAGSFLFGVDSQ
jgi:hypothetical protein